VAISLKRVKVEEKLLWKACWNSLTLFRTVPSATSYGLLFPKIGGSQPPTKTSIAIISGTGKATDFRFGRYIHTSQGPSEQKKPIKNFGEKEAWANTGTAQTFYVPPIISGSGKAMDFKFGRYIHRVHPSKSPLKILEKREHGHTQGLPNFGGTPYYLRNV